jgi:hypothetical protein
MEAEARTRGTVPIHSPSGVTEGVREMVAIWCRRGAKGEAAYGEGQSSGLATVSSVDLDGTRTYDAMEAVSTGCE